MSFFRSSDSSDTFDVTGVRLGNGLLPGVSRTSDNLTSLRAIGEALSIKIKPYIRVRCQNISVYPLAKRLLRMTDSSDMSDVLSVACP